MSHFKAKMHQIIFPASVRPSLRWSLTQTHRIATQPGWRRPRGRRHISCLHRVLTFRLLKFRTLPSTGPRGERSKPTDPGYIYIFIRDKKPRLYAARWWWCWKRRQSEQII